MLNLHKRIQHLIDLWAGGIHPLLCENYIKVTTECMRELDIYIKRLEKENELLSTLVKLYLEV